MKTMKLLPLKIAVTSALIVGLGAASTANAQQQQKTKTEVFLPNLFYNDYIEETDLLYHNMILGDTAALVDRQNYSNSQLKFYSNDEESVPDSLLFSKMLNNQQLNGFKAGDIIIPVDANGQVIYQKDTRVEGGKTRTVLSVTTKIATQQDVDSAYSRGIQGKVNDLDDEMNFLNHDITSLYDVTANQQDDIKGLKKGVKDLKKGVKGLNKELKELDKEVGVLSRDIGSLNDDVAQNNESIEDLYDFSQEVADSIGEIHAHNKAQNETLQDLITNSVENTNNITKNKADIQALENNVVEELFNLSGRLIDQKADLTKDIKTLESNVEEGLLELSGHLIDQKADIAKNQADIAQNQANIQDLAAYNELQDAYAKQQTEAIDALNKASSENTQNIEDLAAYNELQDAYAKQQTEAIDALNKASSENTQNIAKNQADIANNINNIYELAQQQDQHSSDIKTLAKASAANTDRIAKNKADADASFETLTKNQNTLIEKDKEHDKLITANKTAIDENKASADTKFAATADAITKNGNAITKNAKSITDLGTKVDGFDGRVTALDTKVNAFDGRITALDSKVENGMAAQAALSGLFQPYSVGKFNATAALGGYGSKSAVAIGAGYRVNPNLAFKAGAAINTSGNKKGSYNIGVNYEF
uniref:UspA2 n=2 Tax=Moraxella catarrhalis TaxID=480 RepID=Q58XP4_MORCA|nr:UspA2 [Moraxella catarrhalis]